MSQKNILLEWFGRGNIDDIETSRNNAEFLECLMKTYSICIRTVKCERIKLTFFNLATGSRWESVFRSMVGGGCMVLNHSTE